MAADRRRFQNQCKIRNPCLSIRTAGSRTSNAKPVFAFDRPWLLLPATRWLLRGRNRPRSGTASQRLGFVCGCARQSTTPPLIDGSFIFCGQHGDEFSKSVPSLLQFVMCNKGGTAPLIGMTPPTVFQPGQYSAKTLQPFPIGAKMRLSNTLKSDYVLRHQSHRKLTLYEPSTTFALKKAV